jgi:hypothetical protein
VILAGCIAVSAGLLMDIRKIMNRIFGQLREVDSKIQSLPLPRNQIINLEILATKLKKIVLGFRSIKP